MAWNGSGAFSRTDGTHTGTTVWNLNKVAGTKINVAPHDTHDQDLATGINACLAKNGENAMTNDLDMGTFSLSNWVQASNIALDPGVDITGTTSFVTIQNLDASGDCDIGGGLDVVGALSSDDYTCTGTIDTDVLTSSTVIGITAGATITPVTTSDIPLVVNQPVSGSVDIFVVNEESGNIITVDSTGKFRLAGNGAPSSASDTGTTNEIRFDSDYMYRCVATNTWKRTALSTW